METYTTDDALTLMGFGKFQALVLAYAGMGWVAEAMEVMLLSFLGPVVREEWNVSPQDESLLSSVVFAGMLIGACAWGFISDRYGRKSGQWACIFILVLGVRSCRKSWHLDGYFFLFLDYWHSLGGFTCMGFCSSRPLKPEFFFGMLLVMSNIDFFLQAVLSALSWRWLLALSSLPCFLLLLFFRITPESPRYLCAQNRMTDARFVLERMAIANQAALPMGVLTYHQETKTECITHVSEDEHLIPVREKEHTDRNAISSKSGAVAVLHKLLSHNLLKSTLLLWFVYYASSFAYYGITLLTSQLSDVNRSCKSDLVFEVHQNNGNLYKDTFITSLAEIPGLILSALLVDRFGRKATMSCLMFACCAFLGPLVLHQNELLTTTLLFGARACGTGATTTLCLYAPEVYPTYVRSTGVGIATAIGKIGGVICPLVAVGMLRSCHQMEAVLVFELVLFLAGVSCILFPVETKGREMD
ncbi:synaptic vesicle 2-related protein isoform X2 [Zea mays]|nr:synaptic vesicle 2-related protein isoform X2 [Zea mays]XP_035823982.1 synaptic vesicle 2-related protein isoform X2 [Zea mays]